MTPEENYKKLFKPLRLSMYDFNENSVRKELETLVDSNACLLYTSPSPRDKSSSRMPSSA